jgi:hypothetical protein
VVEIERGVSAGHLDGRASVSALGRERFTTRTIEATLRAS